MFSNATTTTPSETYTVLTPAGSGSEYKMTGTTADPVASFLPTSKCMFRRNSDGVIFYFNEKGNFVAA